MQTMTVEKREVRSHKTKQTTLRLTDDNINHFEANEILSKVIKDKINFHKIKNWGSQERFGKNDEFAEKNISELQREIEKLEVILAEAKTQNKKLIVHSEIKITLSDH